MGMQELARTIAKGETFPNPNDFNCLKSEGETPQEGGPTCASLNCYSTGSDGDQFNDGIEKLMARNQECKTQLDSDRLEGPETTGNAEENAAANQVAGTENP